jgi:hypothetical protein
MDLVAENIAISEARANLSDVTGPVRLLRLCVFLMRRDKPQTAVVPVELGELVRAVGGPDVATAIFTAARAVKQSARRRRRLRGSMSDSRVSYSAQRERAPRPGGEARRS